MTVERSRRRHLQGTVTSARALKTITVEVERKQRHARYGKYVRRRKKYLAHDEEGAAREGDLVEIAATRPLSKRKRWRLVRVVRQAVLPEGAAVGEDLTGEEAGAFAGGEER